MSVTQSAHYIVDESGQLHDGNTWGMGNTDRWRIPNRWRVQHGFVPTFRGVMRWKVLAPGAVLPVARFATWREAMEYADRMARTREVVLPRNHDLKKSVHKDINGDLYANYGSASYWVQDNWNKGPKPLALALLALAEQEKP